MPISALGGIVKDTTVSSALSPTATYEADRVSVSAATGGTITLTFTWNGVAYTTAPIAYNAANVVVQQAIQGATGPQGQTLPPNSIIAPAGSLGSGLTILFTGAVVGPITGQTINTASLVGGTGSFTRVIQGIAPILPMTLYIPGSGGVMYKAAGVGAGDGSTQLEVYMGGSPAQGNIGSGVPGAALQVGFKDEAGHLATPSMVAGALTLQSAGIPGSPAPSKVLATGGVDALGNLRTLSVNGVGGLLLQSAGAPGAAAPSVANLTGGVDINGNLRALSVTTGGALSIQDSSSVPEAPLSINGVAFTLGQATAPPGPLTVGTTSTAILPDSTGAGAINGLRGQVEIINVGNTDICVSPSTITVWGTVWILRPGGSLITTYSGPISAISNNTNGGQIVTTPSNLISVMEWA